VGAYRSAGWWFAMMLIPLSLSVAILRYRCGILDIVIRKTTGCMGVLTAILALVFFSGVALLQQVCRAASPRRRIHSGL